MKFQLPEHTKEERFLTNYHAVNVAGSSNTSYFKWQNFQLFPPCLNLTMLYWCCTLWKCHIFFCFTQFAALHLFCINNSLHKHGSLKSHLFINELQSCYLICKSHPVSYVRQKKKKSKTKKQKQTGKSACHYLWEPTVTFSSFCAPDSDLRASLMKSGERQCLK